MNSGQLQAYYVSVSEHFIGSLASYNLMSNEEPFTARRKKSTIDVMAN